MNRPQTRSVSLALGRLRMASSIACWLIGLALGTQIVIWALACYTDLRFEIAEEEVDAPLVVQAESPRHQRNRALHESELGLSQEEKAGKDEEEAVADLVAYSRTDHHFSVVYNLAASVGRATMLALLPIVILGLLLGVSMQTNGVERAVTAFLLLLIVSGLVLPLGETIGLPWSEGALAQYTTMTAAMDHPDSGPIAVPGLVQFLLLPLIAIVGLLVVAVRFSSGLEASLLPRESMRLDPRLEREASNISPTSLHGGRADSVLSSTLGRFESDQDHTPSAREVSRGETPRRLI